MLATGRAPASAAAVTFSGGVASQLAYDFRNVRWLAEVPVYFVPEKGNVTRSGVGLGIRPSRKPREERPDERDAEQARAREDRHQ